MKKQGVDELKKQNFLTGAFILIIANTVSKILGAVFKIPLTYIIGEEGMAIYNTSFNIYVMFLAFVISGLPFAVSKLVSEYSALGKQGMVQYTVKSVNRILLIIGMLGSVLLYFGAEFFALAMKEEKAVFAIRMIAPSVLFVAAGAGIRSYYQGLSNMIPTAVSQVIESITKLAAGYILAKGLIMFGVNIASGGAVLGVTIGELTATAVFVVIYRFSKRDKLKCTPDEKKAVWSGVYRIAVPLLFASVVSSMLSVVDTTVVRSGLINSGFDTSQARRIYGAYTGYALTVFHLPVGILATLGVSLLPVISGAFAVNDMNKARKATFAAFKLTVVSAVPCCVIMLFMSSEILEILFGNTTSAYMLMMVSPCVITMCTANILTSIIQASGRIMTAFAYTALGVGLKIALNAILMKSSGIYGAILSSNISAFCIMLVSMIIVKKIMGLKFKITETIIKPVISGVFMCGIIILIKQPVQMYFNSVFIRTAIISVISLTGYALMTFLMGGFDINTDKLLKMSKINVIMDL